MCFNFNQMDTEFSIIILTIKKKITIKTKKQRQKQSLRLPWFEIEIANKIDDIKIGNGNV